MSSVGTPCSLSLSMGVSAHIPVTSTARPPSPRVMDPGGAIPPTPVICGSWAPQRASQDQGTDQLIVSQTTARPRPPSTLLGVPRPSDRRLMSLAQ